jgi:integrase
MRGTPEILPRETDLASDVPRRQPSASPLALRPFRADDPLYETARSATEFIKAAKADATHRAYASDWGDFESWCRGHGLSFLPAQPETAALYISALARPADGGKPRKASTLTRRLTAIAARHKAEGLDSPAAMRHPLVADALHGIRRTLGTAPAMKKPLTREKIVQMIASLEGPIAAARDKALLLVGFAGSLRRAELAALQVEDIHRHRKGITITIPQSKTDQEKKGREVEILYGVHDRTCPVLALDNWLKIAGITDGHVLRRVGRHGNVGKSLDKDSIGRIVQRLVGRAKIGDPADYGGHSLRAGFVTEASANGATDREIMKQTGHKSVAMVHRYAREDQADRQSAESKLGL